MSIKKHLKFYQKSVLISTKTIFWARIRSVAKGSGCFLHPLQFNGKKYSKLLNLDPFKVNFRSLTLKF